MKTITSLRFSRGEGDARILALLGVGAIALFLGLFFSAHAGLLVLAAAWVVVGTWRYPMTAFLSLLFLAPLLPIVKATQLLAIITPLKDVVIGTLFLRTIALPVIRKEDPYRRNVLLLPILLFVVWVFVGLLRADQTVLGILRIRDLFLYIPLLWIARSLIRTREDLQRVLSILLMSGALVLTLVVVQFFAFPDGMVLRFDPVRNTWFSRASGTLAHPNLLASYLLFLTPLAAALVLERMLPRLWQWFAGLLAAGGLAATIFTYSRSGWIALAVAGAALGAVIVLRPLDFARGTHRRTILITVILGIVAATLLMMFVPRVQTLIRTVADPTYGSNQERLQILAELVADTTNTEALIGRGLGDVLESTRRTVSISLSDLVAADVRNVQVAKARTFVDNAVLKTWIELGIVGVILFGWITWHVLRSAWTVQRTTPAPESRAFARALWAITWGLVALSLFLDVPEIFPVALLFWTLVGLVHAAPYIEKGTGNPTPPRPSHKATAGAASLRGAGSGQGTAQ